MGGARSSVLHVGKRAQEIGPRPGIVGDSLVSFEPLRVPYGHSGAMFREPPALFLVKTARPQRILEVLRED